MSRYRRAHIPGGTFFFTVTLADRSNDTLIRNIGRLRRIYKTVQRGRPFETIAVCILPDHLHAIWSLPEHDTDFAMRKRRADYKEATSEAESWLRSLAE